MKSQKIYIYLLILALMVALGSPAAWAVPVSGDDLIKLVDPEILQKLDQGESHVDIIVLLTDYKKFEGKIIADKPIQMAASQSEILNLQNAVLNKIDSAQFKLKHRFENILGFSGRVTQEGIQALLSMPEVELIEEDKIVKAHLAQGIPVMNATATRASYDGTGVSVAIVDTGVDYTHSQLGGAALGSNTKVIGGYDFGDSDSDPMDCEGHGTQVAGIVAGTLASGPGDYIGGVAHNAKLYALKIVAGCSGSAYNSDIAAAWDWAVTHKNDDPSNPIMIINTSFGGGKYLSAASCDAANPTMATAASNAVANGITPFSSSGNEAYTNGLASPSCVTDSVSVGAVYDANIGGAFFSVCSDPTTAADQVTCYSNSADFLDILAPSHDAYTTAVGGGYSTSFGGTSAASPYAAGAAAVLQHNVKSSALGTLITPAGTFYTPAQLKAAMVDNGDSILDSRNSISKPRVNVGESVGAPTCSYTISPTQKGLDGSGGIGSVSVTAGSGCAWTAVSNDTGWLTVTSGGSGSGDGTVGYSVTASISVAREGTITIAGETFTVYQAADGDVCTDVDNDGYSTEVAGCGPEVDCDDTDPDINPGATETCNGVDDDCDNQIDEDLGTTTCGTGACEVTVDYCVGGDVQTCTPGTPGTESCNNIDDDCDGTTDESLTRSCGTDVGVCVSGTQTCSSGNWGSCVGEVGASTEVCDGRDNDCDGRIDSLSIYADNFSAGAEGWRESDKTGTLSTETDASQNFQDAGQQALSLNEENDTRSIAHTIDYDGGSFTLAYDMYVGDPVSGSAPGFGLSSDPANAFDMLLDRSYLSISYSTGETGPFVRVEGFSGRIARGDFPNEALVQTLLDNNVLYATQLSPEYVFFQGEIESGEQLAAKLDELGIAEAAAVVDLWNRSIAEGSFIEDFRPEEVEGSWWHHEISYDEGAEQVRVVISRGQGGGQAVVDKTYQVMNGFSEEMISLVHSDRPEEGVEAVSSSYIDNITIQSVCNYYDDDDDGVGGLCSVGNEKGPLTLSGAANILILLFLPFVVVGIRRFKRESEKSLN